MCEVAGTELSGMADKESVNITVVIAGRPYPLRINPNDEANIRRIVKEINEKVNRFQRTYTKKDKQDCLAMAILTYAVDLHKAQQSLRQSTDAQLSKKVQHLDHLLDQLLQA